MFKLIRDFFNTRYGDQRYLHAKNLKQEQQLERYAEELELYKETQERLNRNLCALPDLLNLVEKYQAEDIGGASERGKEIADLQDLVNYWRKNYELITSRIDNGEQPK